MAIISIILGRNESKKILNFISEDNKHYCTYFIVCVDIIILLFQEQMEHIHSVKSQAEAFLMSPDFFYYHGIVLSVLWFVVCNIGILLRKVSVYLHAFVFFFVDVTTVVFTVGAIYRVYPYLDRFASKSIIKQGHIIGGTIFVVLVIIQHVGGVITLLNNQKSNPQHRKFAVLVTNFGRILSIFGMILGDFDQNIIIGSSIFAVILLVVSVYKGFFAAHPEPSKQVQKSQSRSPNRQKSPKRD